MSVKWQRVLFRIADYRVCGIKNILYFAESQRGSVKAIFDKPGR